MEENNTPQPEQNGVTVSDLIGNYVILPIVESYYSGMYLKINEEQNVLLPNACVTEDMEIGDEVEVFLYTDSKDRLIATTKEPFLLRNECAFLKVADINRFGAFLDWGLTKHLLVPFKEQEQRLEIGETYCFFMYLDLATKRLAASQNLRKFIKNRTVDLNEGDLINVLLVEQQELGYQVIIENQHWGYLYHNEVFKSLKVGQNVKAYVKKIREDGKIDVTLQQQGYRKIISDTVMILIEALRNNQGFLPLNDKTSPKIIYETLHMSKKNFKKAVGALYRERRIVFEHNGIKLVQDYDKD
ncbi:MAG: CvfB family protein [Chitinophagales bacterium]